MNKRFVVFAVITGLTFYAMSKRIEKLEQRIYKLENGVDTIDV